MGKCTLAGIVMKQRRRAEMTVEQRRIKRNILRKNTGKHLLMAQLLIVTRKIERDRIEKQNLTTAQEVVTS